MPAYYAKAEMRASMWGSDFELRLNFKLRISMVLTGDTRELPTMMMGEEGPEPIQNT